MRERSTQENAYVTGLQNAERAGYAIGLAGKPEHPCPYRRADMCMSFAHGFKRGAAERLFGDTKHERR